MDRTVRADRASHLPRATASFCFSSIGMSFSTGLNNFSGSMSLLGLRARMAFHVGMSSIALFSFPLRVPAMPTSLLFIEQVPAGDAVESAHMPADACPIVVKWRGADER